MANTGRRDGADSRVKGAARASCSPRISAIYSSGSGPLAD